MDPEATLQTHEHAEDVLSQLAAWQAGRARCALVVLSATIGGAVRAPGALLAVNEEGESVGYLSGGCIDSDVVLQAQSVIQSGTAKTVRYGAGSPFVDLPLPCGGALIVRLIPNPDAEIVSDLLHTLRGRRPVSLTLDEDNRLGMSPPATSRPSEDGAFLALLTPRPRLRLAGRGADCLALARLAKAGGWPVRLQLPDEEDIETARQMGFDEIDKLETPGTLDAAQDDPFTAFVLMFHDQDWETPLLTQALAGSAFYIGAVGSRTTHARRCDRLRSAGMNEAEIGRVRGPIGLVPSMRDASMLAVSVLAEIVEAFHLPGRAPLARTAIILLAAGRSSRFEDGDKLMVELAGKPVLGHAAASVADSVVARRVAVIDPDRPEREKLLAEAGWDIAENPEPEVGQASSLKIGLDALTDDIDADRIDSVLILLGDMPAIPPAHLHALTRAMTPGTQAVMSETDGHLGPPALFDISTLDLLKTCTGDRGARQVFDQLAQTTTVSLSRGAAIDIDVMADLEDVRTLHNA